MRSSMSDHVQRVVKQKSFYVQICEKMCEKICEKVRTSCRICLTKLTKEDSFRCGKGWVRKDAL